MQVHAFEGVMYVRRIEISNSVKTLANCLWDFIFFSLGTEMEAWYWEDYLEGPIHEQENLGSCSQRVRISLSMQLCVMFEQWRGKILFLNLEAAILMMILAFLEGFWYACVLIGEVVCCSLIIWAAFTRFLAFFKIFYHECMCIVFLTFELHLNWFLIMPVFSWLQHSRGETLSSISKLYGVPILEIAASNEDIADVNLVFEGQSLKIPSAAEWAQLVRHIVLHYVHYLCFCFHLLRFGRFPYYLKLFALWSKNVACNAAMDFLGDFPFCMVRQLTFLWLLCVLNVRSELCWLRWILYSNWNCWIWKPLACGLCHFSSLVPH